MEDHAELRARLNALVDALVAEGHYQTAEDVTDAIAQIVGAFEKKVAAFYAAIDEGEASGFAEPFDLDEFLAEMRDSKDEQSAAE